MRPRIVETIVFLPESFKGEPNKKSASPTSSMLNFLGEYARLNYNLVMPQRFWNDERWTCVHSFETFTIEFICQSMTFATNLKEN